MPVYEGTIGAEIAYEVQDEAGAPLDISGATGLKFRILKPNGVSVDVTPQFDTDGTDGVLIYITTQNTELTPGGYFKVQPYFRLGLFDGFAAPALFSVGNNLTAPPPAP